jgi:CRP-like cAMP-binding protein
MGGKCIKDIKVINYAHMDADNSNPNKETNNNRDIKGTGMTDQKMVEKNSSSNSKSGKLSVITKNTNGLDSPKKTNKDSSSVSPKKSISKIQSSTNSNKNITLSDNKIDINSNIILNTNNVVNPISTHEEGVRKNSKKHKVAIESLVSNESEVLKIVKKHNKEFEDSKLIDNCLTKHFFMRVLDKASRAEIIKEMSLASVNEGEMIFNQGTMGNFFYIIKEGKVELLINDNPIKSLEEGESFGELALLHGAARSGSIKASTNCLMWVLERKNFKKIVDHINHINFQENKKFLLSIPILVNIENDQKAILCSNLIKELYEPGDTIVKEGEVANCLYIVKEGEVDCINKGSVVRTLKKGEHFGERAILLESLRTMDVVAKTKCTCYSISIETLKSMVGERYRDVLYLNFIKSAFATSKYLKRFNLKLIESSYECFQVINYSKGDIVLNKGYAVASKLIVVIEGNLVNVKTKSFILFFSLSFFQ